MSKRYPKKPKFDIEYSFVFTNGSRATLRLHSINDDGTYKFYNVDTKQFAKKNCSPRHFDYMCQYNLTRARPATSPIEIEVREKYPVIDTRNLRFLEALDESQKPRFTYFFDDTVENFIKRYKTALRRFDEETINELRHACLFLDKI